jgi:hypothetical protein
MTMSSCPKWAMVWAMVASAWDRSVMSVSMARAVPPHRRLGGERFEAVPADGHEGVR